MTDSVLTPPYGAGPALPISMPVVLQGAPGASAYEVARAAGFAGTQAEWLVSLIGNLAEDDRALVRQALDMSAHLATRIDKVDDAVAQSAEAAGAAAREAAKAEEAAQTATDRSDAAARALTAFQAMKIATGEADTLAAWDGETLTVPKGRAAKFVVLTQAAYDALPLSAKADTAIAYLVTG